MTRNKAFSVFAVLLCLNLALGNTIAQEEITTVKKYPDYGYMFMGKDKCENFNRKIFAFNLKLNKFVIKPVHRVWASVMPQYGMDRIQSAHTNLVYPKRLVSTLIQKDFKSAKNETIRFFANTTVGLGGLYDPAKRYLKIEPVDEDMEQALAKCRIKKGPYLVIPVLTSSCPRDLAGRILDWALDPSSYVATPVLAIVKAGLTVNRTSYMQPLVKMLESTYADPYEIAKKLYGLESHIKVFNYDRPEVLQELADNMQKKQVEEEQENSLTYYPQPRPFISLEDDVLSSSIFSEAVQELSVANLPSKLFDPLSFEVPISDIETNKQNIALTDVIRGGARTDAVILPEQTEAPLEADLLLEGYNPQGPVIDSMRTALFDLPGISDSMWNELSLWNRCFSNKIRTSSVNISPERENYRYRYILQKDKTAPVAIVYPSIGEGIMSYHSVVLAKLFFDAGYSVIIQGSNFQWEFVKSMPKDYRPGIPAQDAHYLREVTSKILTSLQTKHNCQPREKLVIGTSFGALATLFLADQEYKENTLNITKFISINPPINLMYAMKQIDRNTEEWNKNPDDLQNRVAITAAKVIQVTKMKDLPDKNIEALPFSDEEAKLITGFIMHQKLSDIIFTIENASKCKKCDIYERINAMNYNDYAQKYLANGNTEFTEKMNSEASLFSISDFLKNSTNYRIYHTLDDYLVNTTQLRQLKKYAGNKAVLISNGSHLGFLYRPEFIQALIKDITLSENKLAESNS